MRTSPLRLQQLIHWLASSSEFDSNVNMRVLVGAALISLVCSVSVTANPS